MTFETNGLKGIYFQEVETQALSTRGQPDVNLLTVPPSKGMADAAILAGKLKEVGVTHVYSSPFRRVLQTATPFLEESGLRARVDWALYEHPDPHGGAVQA